ncbi:hypothetical protein [Pararhodobacter zhoushanensis]|uniref:Chemotaxis protein n=1 Tax=Pararhodobacter zhoushanensis TaxID=2479545 RepID=A0ABT3GXW5_9RHOB|nr:hypothetical protein [Pararhodobacter zhoushanensis]MCW1932393.1 hypothetical protein [Pararhodobacter zhoushanensis]
MNFLSDLLLAAAALGAGLYCVILSRRLSALGSLEGGMGSAIAMLSAQVDDLARSLKAAQETAGRSGAQLEGQTARAETVARKLQLLVASLHDLPDEPVAQPQSVRPPSPWPTETAQRGPARVAEPEAPPRARVLRRRHAPEAS